MKIEAPYVSVETRRAIGWENAEAILGGRRRARQPQAVRRGSRS